MATAQYTGKHSENYKPSSSKYKIIIPAVALVSAGLGAIGGVVISNRNHNNSKLESTVEAAAPSMPLSQPASAPQKSQKYDENTKYTYIQYDENTKYILQTHYVKKGETLAMIANDNKVILRYFSERYSGIDLSKELREGTGIEVPLPSILKDQEGIIGKTIDDLIREIHMM